MDLKIVKMVHFMLLYFIIVKIVGEKDSILWKA